MAVYRNIFLTVIINEFDSSLSLKFLEKGHPEAKSCKLSSDLPIEGGRCGGESGKRVAILNDRCFRLLPWEESEAE